MNIITIINNKIKDIFKECGYELDKIDLKKSSRKDLGDYQINECMSLAKSYHKSPQSIANEVADQMNSHDEFVNVNVAGPGFINITLSEKFLLDNVNSVLDNPKELIDKEEPKKIVIDYGGANVAKALHVGHLRSANIGEALKRLAAALGHEVIGDAHLGDYGRPLGFVVKELKERYPDLPYFDESYEGDYSEVELPISNEEGIL